MLHLKRSFDLSLGRKSNAVRPLMIPSSISGTSVVVEAFRLEMTHLKRLIAVYAPG